VECVIVIENCEVFTTVSCLLRCFLLSNIYRKENINITFPPNLSCDLLQYNFFSCPQVRFIIYDEWRWEFCILLDGIHCCVTKKHDNLKENEADILLRI